MVVGVLSIGAAAGGETRPAQKPAGKAPAGVSQAEIEALIRQLGSERWKVREAASKKLAAMGPEILPLLQKYRTHPDLEIAARVRALIDQFAWVTRGALVVKILPGSQAERLGIRAGDVFVRVDDLDVTSFADLRKVDYEQGRTYVVLRAGKLSRVRAGPGLVGCYCINWDQAYGGDDHARGVAALVTRRHDEAYRHLLAAYEAGTEAPWTVMKLWGLAEYALDHKRAMAIHRLFVGRYPTFSCAWSHDDIDGSNYGLPMSSVHTQHLLDRRKNEKFSPDLYHRLDSYFVLAGRNLPLARQTTARAWPEDKKIDAHYLLWHRNCRMAVALHDGKWKQVADEYDAASGDLWTNAMALRAAVELGDVPAACRIGHKLLEAYGRSPRGRSDEKESDRLHEVSHVLYAVAAALADGRDAQARELLERASRAGSGLLNEILARPAVQACRHSAIAPKMALLLAEHVGNDAGAAEAPQTAGGERRHLAAAYLDFLACKPELTAEEWQKAVRRLSARVLLRLGRYDEARQALKERPPADGPGVREALELLAAGQARLNKDWAPLRGVCEAYPARREGARWAVRYDGRTFHVDPDGRLREVPGLAAGQLHQADHHDEIRCFPTGTVYFRRSRVYLLDDEHRRWVATFSTPFVGRGTDWRDAAAPAMLRYLLGLRRHDPAAQAPLEVIRHVAGPGQWWVHHFSDELALAAHARTRKLLDLPLEIARKTGRKGRAAVYRVRKLNDRRMLVPTNAGLWVLDADGRLARVKLPLKDQNVMVSLMTWPKREGKVYVGVAPQQGGQIVEIDARSGEARLTGGYCGQGPDDAFAARTRCLASVYCEAAIQRIYERRLIRHRTRRIKPATVQGTGGRPAKP